MIIIKIKSKENDKYEQFLTKDIEKVNCRIRELKKMGIGNKALVTIAWQAKT